jgi:uncharacterized protein (DUF58 family)
MITNISDKIKNIEIKTKKLVNNFISGKYSSSFKGAGIEFSDVKDYVPGDDYRFIDWKLTAKFDKPYIKQFIEERNLNIIFLVDTSSSYNFSTVTKTKLEYVAEICSLLGYSACKNNDKTGAIFFGNQNLKYLNPEHSFSMVYKILKHILKNKNAHTKSDLKQVFNFCLHTLKKNTVIFLFTNFYSENYEELLKLLNYKFDLNVINIYDKLEKHIPDCGILNLCNLNKNISLNSFDKNINNSINENNKNLYKFFKKNNISHLDLEISEPYLIPLIKYFRKLKNTSGK